MSVLTIFSFIHGPKSCHSLFFFVLTASPVSVNQERQKRRASFEHLWRNWENDLFSDLRKITETAHLCSFIDMQLSVDCSFTQLSLNHRFQNMHLSFLKKQNFYVYDKCLCLCGAFTLWMSEVFLTASFSVQNCWFLPLLHPRLGSISLILLLFLWTISCPMSLLSTEKTNVPSLHRENKCPDHSLKSLKSLKSTSVHPRCTSEHFQWGFKQISLNFLLRINCMCSY